MLFHNISFGLVSFLNNIGKWENILCDCCALQLSQLTVFNSGARLVEKVERAASQVRAAWRLVAGRGGMGYVPSPPSADAQGQRNIETQINMLCYQALHIESRLQT
jgi:hypothetical protein